MASNDVASLLLDSAINRVAPLDSNADVSGTVAPLEAVDPRTAVAPLEAIDPVKVKSVGVNASAASKTLDMEETVDRKALGLGHITIQEFQTKQNIRSLKRAGFDFVADPDFRTNPNQILTDAQANDDGLGQVTDKVILGVSSAAQLATSVVTQAPDFINKTASELGKFSLVGEILKPIFPDAVEAVGDAVTDNPVANAAGAFKDNLNSMTESLAKAGADLNESIGTQAAATASKELQEQLGIDFDNADGFVNGVGLMKDSILSNPEGSVEMLIQSLPHMIALATKGVPGAAALVGVAGSNLEENTAEFAKQHDGRAPDSGETVTLIGASLAQAFLDKTGAEILLTAPLSTAKGTILTKAVSSLVGKAVGTKAGKVASKVPFAKTTGKGGVGVVTESGEEALQSVIGDVAARDDLGAITDPEVLKKAAVAAGSAAGTGGALGGGRQLVSDVAEATKDAGTVAKAGVTAAKAGIDKVGTVAKDLKKTGSVADVDTAVESGDPLEVVDTVNQLDLTGMSAEERVVQLERVIDAEEAVKQEARDAEPESEAQNVALKKLTEVAAIRETLVAQHRALKDKEEGVNVDEEIDTVVKGEETPGAIKKAIGRIFGSSRFRSDIPEARINELANSEAAQQFLSDTQKTELKLIQQRHKTANNVSSDVTDGDKLGAFKGTNEHLSDLDGFLADGSKKLAQGVIAHLKDFAKSRVDKANAIVTAIDNGDTGTIDIAGVPFELMGQKSAHFAKNTIIGKDLKAINAAIAEAEFRFEQTFGEAAQAAPATPETVEVTPEPTQTPEPAKTAEKATQEATEEAVQSEEVPEAVPEATKETSLERALRETKEAEQKSEATPATTKSVETGSKLVDMAWKEIRDQVVELGQLVNTKKVQSHIKKLLDVGKSYREIYNTINEKYDLTLKIGQEGIKADSKTDPETGSKKTEDARNEKPSREIELFPGVNANAEQVRAIDQILAFLKGDAKEFTLIGRGGTGKTTIIGKAVELSGLHGTLYAPTNKAAAVLEQASDRVVFTVAKGLARIKADATTRDGPDRFITNPNALAKAKEEISKSAKNNDPDGKPPVYTGAIFIGKELIIIDEASMLSGQDMADIKELIHENDPNNKYNTKIIYMGDNAQLPPVIQNKQGIEDSPVFDVPDQAALTVRMRQGEGSPIPKLTDTIIENIEKEEDAERIAINPDQRVSDFDNKANSGLIFTDITAMWDQWLKDYLANPVFTKLLTFNNAQHNSPLSVGNLNRKARKIIFGDDAKNRLNNNENIVLRSSAVAQKVDPENNFTVLSTENLAVNSELHVEEISEPFNAPDSLELIRFDEVEEEFFTDNVTLPRNLPIEVYKVRVRMGDEYYELHLPTDKGQVAVKAVIEHFKNSNEFATAGKVKDAFGEYDYAYAINSHIAQGSTYRNVYVLEDNITGDSGPKTNKEKNQALYTAMSRASDKLVMVSDLNNADPQTGANFSNQGTHIIRKDKDIAEGTGSNIDPSITLETVDEAILDTEISLSDLESKARGLRGRTVSLFFFKNGEKIKFSKRIDKVEDNKFFYTTANNKDKEITLDTIDNTETGIGKKIVDIQSGIADAQSELTQLHDTKGKLESAPKPEVVVPKEIKTTIAGIPIKFISVPRIDNGALGGTNGKTGLIKLVQDITAKAVLERIVDLVPGEAGSAQKVLLTNVMQAGGVNLIPIIKAMTDTQAKEFVLLHEYRHSKQDLSKYFTDTNQTIAEQHNLADPGNKFLGDTALKLEMDANMFALDALGLLPEGITVKTKLAPDAVTDVKTAVVTKTDIDISNAESIQEEADPIVYDGEDLTVPPQSTSPVKTEAKELDDSKDTVMGANLLLNGISEVGGVNHGISSLNLMVATDKVIKGLIHKVENIFTNFNSKAVQEFLPEVNQESLTSVLTFVGEFIDDIAGIEGKLSPLLNLLDNVSHPRIFGTTFKPVRHKEADIIAFLQNADPVKYTSALDVKNIQDIINGLYANDPDLIFELSSENLIVSTGKDRGDLVQNPFGLLIQQDHSKQVNFKSARFINENVLTTMALVMHNWMATQATKTIYNHDPDINSILGKPKNADVDVAEKELISPVGSVRTPVAENLGNAVLARLGVAVKQNKDGTIDSRMAQAIGQLMIASMVNKGLLIESVQNMGELKAEIASRRNEKYEGSFNDRTTNFIKVATVLTETGELQPILAIEQIIDDGHETAEAVNVVMQLPHRTVTPNFKPNPVPPKKMQGTGQDVPQKQQDTMAKLQQVAHGFKPNMNSLVSWLGKRDGMRIQGYIENVNENVNTVDAVSVRGKNLSIERELQFGIDFIAETEANPDRDMDSSFFFDYVVYKQSRFGIASNTISLTGSKIHRHMFGIKSHMYTVTTSAHRQQFKYAVALAFGQPVDNQPGAESIAFFDNLMKEQTTLDAIEAIRAIESGNPISDADSVRYREAILTAVGTKEGFAKLDALSNMARYSNNEPFSTNLSSEADGKTSGPAIINIQTMPNDDSGERAAEGGLFTDGTTDYGEWKKDPTHLDTYQRLSVAWKNKVTEQLEGNVIAKGIEHLLGSMTDVGNLVFEITRDMAKNPVTVSTFGGSITTVKRTYAQDILKSFYAQLTEFQNDPVQLQRITDAMNALYTGSDKFNFTTENALNIRLSPGVTKNIIRNINDTYGKVLGEVLTEQTAGVKEHRDLMNMSLNAVFKAFHAAFKKEVAAKIKTNKGQAISRKQKAEIVKSLQQYMPIFRTPLSEHAYKDGIISINTTRETDYSEPVQVGLTRPRPEGEKSVTGYGSTQEYSDGGVGGVIGGLHATDSAINQAVLDEIEGVHLYDAVMYSTEQIEAGVDIVNEAFRDVNYNYHMMLEIKATFDRVMSDLQTNRPEEYKLVERQIKNEADIFREGDLSTVSEISEKLGIMGEKSKQDKQAFFDAPLYVGQNYPWPGTGKQNNFVGPPERTSESETQEDIDEALIAIFKDIIDAIDNDPDNTDSFGSSAEDFNINLFNTVAGDPLSSDNVKRIFDAVAQLGNVNDSSEHTQSLSSLIDGIIKTAMEPMSELNIKFRASGNETLGQVRNVENGNKIETTAYIKTALGTVGNAVQMSAQEVYAHEMVHIIIQHMLDDRKNFKVKQEILKLYDEAKKVASIDMFLPDNGPHSADTLRAARLRYEYIFENKDSRHTVTRDSIGAKVHNYENNFLHEFVAFGLTNAKMKRLLSEVSTQETDQGIPSIWERLAKAWWSLVGLIAGRVKATKHLSGDEALLRLVEDLTEQQERKRTTLLNYLHIPAGFNKALADALRTVIWRPAQTLAALNPEPSKYNLPQSVLNFTVAAFDNPQELGRVMNQVSKNIGMTEQSFLKRLVREGLGITSEAVLKYHTLLRFSKKFIDQERKHLSEEINRQIKETFYEQDMSEETAKAINRALLKTDLIALFDNGFTPERIIDLLRNNSKLRDEIAVQEDKIKIYADAGYYLDQSIGLGRYMAQGQTHIDGQMLNANKIASLAGVETRSTLEGDLSEQIIDIDKLATLYALEYTHSAELHRTADIIESEYAASTEAGTNMNGIVNLLNMHRGFKQNSLEQIFDNNPMLTIKGYTVETFNPSTDIKTVVLKTDATELRKQLEELANTGFVRVEGEIVKDIKDPNQHTAVMYRRNDETTNTWLKSIAGLTAERRKGTSLTDAYLNEGLEGANVAAVLARETVRQRENRFVERQFDVPVANRTGDTNKLVPVSNDEGKTVGYRYLMSEDNKIRLLEKDDNFSAVMGRMHSSVQDKKSTKFINRKLIELNLEDFNDNFARNPSDFVEVSSFVTDPERKEIYDLLPDDTKRYIKTQFPRGRMWVRASTLDLQFGYRKFSVANTNMGKKINDHINKLVWAFSPGSPYKNLVGSAEKLWQGTVSTAKDFIVIKSGVVLAGNVLSNEMLLFAKGVPLGTTFSDQALALEALNTFMGEVTKKNELNRELEFSKTLSIAQRNSKEAELARLNESLATNPVKDLIDEGIFQSIAEDIEQNDLSDQYSLRNKLEKKVKPYVDKVPDMALQTYKHGYLTHDTHPYKLLLRGTQFSDFIARFTLYNHNLEKGMGREEALADIIETFINYDIPTGKFMQYMNDMGFLLFTKFLFRIQRVILKSMKGQPANNLALYSLQAAIGDASDIPDSFLLSHGVLLTLPTDIIDSATTHIGFDVAKDVMSGATDVLPL